MPWSQQRPTESRGEPRGVTGAATTRCRPGRRFALGAGVPPHTAAPPENQGHPWAAAGPPAGLHGDNAPPVPAPLPSTASSARGRRALLTARADPPAAPQRAAERLPLPGVRGAGGGHPAPVRDSAARVKAGRGREERGTPAPRCWCRGRQLLGGN